MYIVCKNSCKFKAKIIFYYRFSITCQKYKFPWQRRLHIHSYLHQSSLIIHQLSQKVFKMSSAHLHTCTQTSSPLINCSTDDLEVGPGPLLHESLNEVVYVTDSRAVDALLQLAPDCIVHWIRAIWRPLRRWNEIWSFVAQYFDCIIGTVSRSASCWNVKNSPEMPRMAGRRCWWHRTLRHHHWSRERGPSSEESWCRHLLLLHSRLCICTIVLQVDWVRHGEQFLVGEP